MPKNIEKLIIESAKGNITGNNVQDDIVLKGIYKSENKQYIKDLELTLNPGTEKSISLKLPYEGYEIQLFIVNFTGDDRLEIMIRGESEGPTLHPSEEPGLHAIAVIYKYENNNLIEIFNHDKFYKENICSAKYKNGYKVNISCGNKKYSLDISKKLKSYLDNIFNTDGSVKSYYDPFYEPHVNRPFEIYPIKSHSNNHYELLIEQVVMGTGEYTAGPTPALAIIQTFGYFEKSEFNIKDKGLLIF